MAVSIRRLTERSGDLRTRWDGAKGVDDQGSLRKEEREKVEVWEDKGAQTEDNREEPPNNGDKEQPLVRSTKKRRLLRAAKNPPLRPRMKRHRFTSPLLSNEDEDFEGGFVLEGKISYPSIFSARWASRHTGTDVKTEEW